MANLMKSCGNSKPSTGATRTSILGGGLFPRTGKDVAFHSPAHNAWMQMTGASMATRIFVVQMTIMTGQPTHPPNVPLSETRGSIIRPYKRKPVVTMPAQMISPFLQKKRCSLSSWHFFVHWLPVPNTQHWKNKLS